MGSHFCLETPRLRLRQWREQDSQPFFEMNSDPEVMRYFPSCLSRAESDTLMERLRSSIDADNIGFYAVETQVSGQFVGMIGLLSQSEESALPFAPGIEIGWRLAKSAWGQGYATEGAKEVLRYGFQSCGFDSIYSITALINSPSRRVMEKIGMKDSHCNFHHPALDREHTLAQHCLYRMTAAEACRAEQ